MTDEDDDTGSFLRARTVAGLTLFGLVVILALMDVFSTDYTLDLGTLGLMLGTGGVLLGVDPIRRALK